jgi:hypothetical protein
LPFSHFCWAAHQLPPCCSSLVPTALTLTCSRPKKTKKHNFMQEAFIIVSSWQFNSFFKKSIQPGATYPEKMNLQKKWEATLAIV